jgi:hypothetical protein
MPKYDVLVLATMEYSKWVEVEADSDHEAADRALEEIGDDEIGTERGGWTCENTVRLDTDAIRRIG